MINNINGKVAGVNISSSSSGIGGSAKVVLRGNKSVSGSNQVLYVIDGVPINNNSSGVQPGNMFGGERDPGDPIALINPDDVESMSVLKGASAAALYGSQAANGVIPITTKSGKNGRTTIDFSSSAQIETPAVLPRFQNSYARGADGENTNSVTSWVQTPPMVEVIRSAHFSKTEPTSPTPLTCLVGMNICKRISPMPTQRPKAYSRKIS